MKVNWIKSIAYGIGVASLDAIPQIGFAQSGNHVPPNGWNNFNPTAATQPQRTNPAERDPASPQFRTVSSAAQQNLGQQVPAQSNRSTTQRSYSAPPSLVAPKLHTAFHLTR